MKSHEEPPSNEAIPFLPTNAPTFQTIRLDEVGQFHGESRRRTSLSDPLQYFHSPHEAFIDLERQKPEKEEDFVQDPDAALPNNLDEMKKSQASNLPEIGLQVKIGTWFTPYRKLLVLVFSLNLVGVALELSGYWDWAKRNLTTLVVGNMLVAMLVRSEWVIRLLYWLAVKIFRPSIFPVCLRINVVGILYHIGGLHSGCGMSTLLWHTVACYHLFEKANLYHISVLISLALDQTCLLAVCLSALPVIRARFHNLFESVHRFLGWLGLLSTVSFLTLKSLWDVEKQQWDMRASRVLLEPGLWFLVVNGITVVLNWITTVKVPVTIYAPSEKASVIRVPGGLTSGLHTRISLGGLREWHIFGSISEGKEAEYHYIVAAVQGDFTRTLNTQKASTLYTKTWKPCGLPYFSRLFKRGVAVCTGSGIGAVASTCIQHDNWFLIWIGPDLETTYGTEILDLISDRIPSQRRLIWDTCGPLGRPDVPALIQSMHKQWEAEVTLFIGSPELNESVLRSCRALEIPAFVS